MIQLEKPTLGQITYLLNFRVIMPNIRFEQAQAENAFSGFIGTQSQQTNLPDEADPNLARIYFQNSGRQIAISQTGCQFDLSFHDAGLPFAEQLEIAKTSIGEFYSNSLKFRDAESYGLTAIILGINFSSKTHLSALHDYLYSKFICTPRIAEVASVQVNLGYKIGSHFVNFGASVYEMRKLEIASAMPKSVQINIADLSVQDSGLSFKIDINNRPQLITMPSGAAENPKNLLSTLDAFLEGQFEKISGLTIS